jgi:hypothetical protein
MDITFDFGALNISNKDTPIVCDVDYIIDCYVNNIVMIDPSHVQARFPVDTPHPYIYMEIVRILTIKNLGHDIIGMMPLIDEYLEIVCVS